MSMQAARRVLAIRGEHRQKTRAIAWVTQQLGSCPGVAATRAAPPGARGQVRVFFSGALPFASPPQVPRTPYGGELRDSAMLCVSHRLTSFHWAVFA